MTRITSLGSLEAGGRCHGWEAPLDASRAISLQTCDLDGIMYEHSHVDNWSPILTYRSPFICVLRFSSRCGFRK